MQQRSREFKGVANSFLATLTDVGNTGGLLGPISVEVAVRRPRRAEQQSRVPQLVTSMKGIITSWLCYFLAVRSPALTFHQWCQGWSDLFLLLLLRLKTIASTDTSEVQTKLTVGFVPQCCISTIRST